MKRIPAAPGRAVDFARSPPAGAFVGFVYYSALFPGRRLFPPVEQHSQHAARRIRSQRHIAAVPGRLPDAFAAPAVFSLHQSHRTGAPCEEISACSAEALPGGSPALGHLFSACPQLLQNLAPAAHWVLQAGQTTIPAFSSGRLHHHRAAAEDDACSITWKISYGTL